jgi:hypothetical protein
MHQARDEEPGTRNIGRADRAPLGEGGMVEVRNASVGLCGVMEE